MTYYILAVFCLSAALFIYILLPETKGRPLNEIIDLLIPPEKRRKAEKGNIIIFFIIHYFRINESKKKKNHENLSFLEFLSKHISVNNDSDSSRIERDDRKLFNS